MAYADARGPSRARPNIATYLVVWSTVGLSVTAYLAYASVFLLGVFCILCGVVYVATLGIFLLTPSEHGTPWRRLPSAIVRDIRDIARHPVGLVVTLIFIGGTLGAAAWFRGAPSASVLAVRPETAEPISVSTEDQRSEFERFWESQPRVDVRADADDARVVVIKFNDYQCPACAQTYMAYDPIFEKYESSHPGQVRLVMRDFPLDSRCNDASPSGPHSSACDAAVAVRLAREVGVEEARRMEEWLYSNQEAMTPEAGGRGVFRHRWDRRKSARDALRRRDRGRQSRYCGGCRHPSRGHANLYRQRGFAQRWACPPVLRPGDRV